MIVIQGEGISGGAALGTLHLFRRTAAVLPSKGAGLEREKARFAQARRRAADELESLAEQCRGTYGDDAADLFDAYAMLTEDEDFAAHVLSALEEKGCSAERAVQQAGERLAAMLSATDDPALQARAADVRDVTQRILGQLLGAEAAGPVLCAPVILAADDLSPSELLRMDRGSLLGFLTRDGSANSHTAILARTMGIPAVCGLGDGLNQVREGQRVCLDGTEGTVYLEPDEATLRLFREERARQQERKTQPEFPDVPPDEPPEGRRIRLCCNIGAPSEVEAVHSSGGQGVGLFRSELLFLAAGRPLTEEEQFRAYRSAAEAMEGRRVVIRTLDIGADKQVAHLGLPGEENPAMGLRGVRLCLKRPELFHTQLRALYRASAYGRVAILFPMIASLWEVEACRQACASVMEELARSGVPFEPDTELGIMIETPAAVLIAPELARQVDFFSVGTNDLTQYTLACDRQRGDLSRFYDPCHPAVLRSVKLAADAAHDAGIRVSVCGDLGADPEMLPVFLDMGIDELSVPPAAVPALRAAMQGRGITAPDR